MTTVLVDGSNVGIASHVAGEELVDPLHRPSGAIFGMLRSIRPILEKVQTDGGPGSRSSVVVAWDSGTNWRTQIYPEYEASRRAPDPEKEKRMERYFDQIPRLRALLPIAGIGQVKADGYEADDIAGWITSTCPDKQFVLVTNDKDWLQLVAHNVHVWRPMKEVLVTPANFTEQTGADDPGQYTQMMGLTGDDGDDVPGAPGIGQGFALKYLSVCTGTKRVM
jgi:5'-3' exonuclease